MDPLPTTPTTSSSAEFLPAGRQELKKYIRTFEGDVETVKKGGAPDLAPLRARTPTPSERLVAPSPLPPVPTIVPTPLPTALPAVPPPAPVATPVIPQSTPLQTYAGDFAKRMKETKASTATILAAEQDAASAPVESSVPVFSISSILYSVAGILLLVAGGIGAYVAYTRYFAASAPVILAPTVAAPIFIDEREQISGAGTALLQAIKQSATRPLAAGSVRLLYLDDMAAASIFSALQLPTPSVLLRNSNAAQSMAGIVNAGGTQSPFFILSVTSYGTTFGGMLQWEPTMPRDLNKLFPPFAEGSGGQAATATTTVATTTQKNIGNGATTTVPSQPLTTGFFDTTIANHDVRVYRDASGRDIVLYGYWNQTTLVIARNAASFTEIMTRLATSRTP